jgi:hypothetical protein
MGGDFSDFVFKASGLTTTAVYIRDWKQSIEAEFIEVFISRKAAADSQNLSATAERGG